MSDNELEIRRAASTEKHWREKDIEVALIPGLALPACRFYSASQRTLPVHGAATYARLQSGEIVSQSDRAALDKILAACDARSASAPTWAELLARFSWDVGPGEVMYQREPPLGEGDAPKGPFTPPEIVAGPERRVHFFLKNPETQKRYEISAILGDKTVSLVSKKKVD